VGQARRFVSDILFDLPHGLRDSVTVMVSELSTNALVHASTGFDVGVERSDAAVTISITDRGDGTPAVQSPGSSEPHGRGLRIVEALSDDWGIMSSPEAGKTVWFRMSLHRASIGNVKDVAFATTEGEPTDRVDLRPSHPAAAPTVSEISESDRPTAHHRFPRRHARARPRTPDQRQSLGHSTNSVG
jgi:anti-sigma regulatory factor (Ser/Thr protein kinase)